MFRVLVSRLLHLLIHGVTLRDVGNVRSESVDNGNLIDRCALGTNEHEKMKQILCLYLCHYMRWIHLPHSE